MINRALRLLRVYHNLKQKDLAKRLDISPSYLSEIESGVKGVSYELLEKYAKALRVPISTITMFAEASAAKDGQTFVGALSDKALKLLEWFETISAVDSSNAPKKPRA